MYNSTEGYTLVELTVVLVVLGALAVIALPRFFSLDSYQARTAYDEIATALRYAQKLAVGSGCEVQVVFAGSSYALQQHETDCTTGSFTTISDHPINSGNVSDVSLSATPASFIFDPMGRCTNGTVPVPVEVTVGAGVDGRTITVVGETGYVDAP